MNRRNFFKAGSLALGAVAISNIAGSAMSKILAGTKISSESFSLELITDNQPKAVQLAEEFMNLLNPSGGVIKYSEYRLDKTESADIVLIRKSRLVNYKTGSDDIQKQASEIAKELDLPRIINNPVRIKFSSSDTEDAASNFLIFHKERLIEKIPAVSSNTNVIVHGSKGDLTVNFSGKKARVVQSSCIYKNCINSGSISISGENIVCIPNQVHIIAE